MEWTGQSIDVLIFFTISKQHSRKYIFCLNKGVMWNRLTACDYNTTALTEVIIINKILIIPYWRLLSSIFHSTPFGIVIRIINVAVLWLAHLPLNAAS